MKSKYTYEVLAPLVAESFSVAEVLRKLNKQNSGSTHVYISKRIRLLEIDTSHFTGAAHNRGKIKDKTSKLYLLVLRKNDEPKVKAGVLRQAMIEYGLKYKCSICEIDEWQNRKITLEIDHINGNPWDNRIENLRFLCPNCHSQTETFGRRKVKETRCDCGNLMDHRSVKCGVCYNKSRSYSTSTSGEMVDTQL